MGQITPILSPKIPKWRSNIFFYTSFMSGIYSRMKKHPSYYLEVSFLSRISHLDFFPTCKVQKGPGTGPLYIFSNGNASIWYSHMFILRIEAIRHHFTTPNHLKFMICPFCPLLQVSAHLNNRSARAHPVHVTTLNLISPSSQINFQHFAKNRMLKALS